MCFFHNRPIRCLEIDPIGFEIMLILFFGFICFVKIYLSLFILKRIKSIQYCISNMQSNVKYV